MTNNVKLLFLFTVAVVTSSCKDFGNKNTKVINTESSTNAVDIDSQMKQILYLNETDSSQNIFPHAVTDLISSNISNHVFEGLVKFNPKDLSVVPALAESWTIDSTKKVYTFILRKDAFFHDDVCFADGKGRKINAQDFVFSFALLCSNTSFNNAFSSTFKNTVKGANLYYEASKKGTPDFNIEGVKAIGDNVVEITLENSNRLFLQILCSVPTSVIAKEAFEKYKENCTVGSGPFLYQNIKNANQIILAKNQNYYLKDKEGRKLPYLDKIIISFNNNQLEELRMFKEKRLDIVNSGLPIKSINDFLKSEMKSFQNKNATFLMELSPNMSTQFYVFNISKKPFNNKKLRQAISYAIDRDKIVAEVLNGQATSAGVYGIVPTCFKEYKSTSIKGYNLNIEKAKKLLAEAGYPNGKGLEPIQLKLNSGGARNTMVALDIQKQLKNNLNIDIEFEIMSLPTKLEAERNGKGDLFRTAWYADYPSPQSFFTLFYGKTVPSNVNTPSFPNTSRFRNEQFDELYELALKTTNDSLANNFLLQAEQILMNEAPILVLWYDQNFRLVQSRVKNYYFNPMDYRNCTEVYIE